MRVQFELSRCVEQEVAVVVVPDALLESCDEKVVDVFFQKFHAPHQCAVRPEAFFFHDFFDGDKLAHVKCRSVLQFFRRGGGVKVHAVYGSLYGVAVRLHLPHVRRLADTRRSYDELSVLHTRN